MELRVAADLDTDSIVDGPGLRIVLWTQGCSHNCPGCHNPGTHDFNGGLSVDVDIICEEIKKLKYHSGLTISGGDPMFQPEACSRVAAFAKKLGMNIWVYTGFTFEELLNMSNKNKKYLEFLKNIDVLIDGKFILAKKNLNLLYRGSSNQRIIDVPSSLKKKETVLKKEYYSEEKEEVKEKIFI